MKKKKSKIGRWIAISFLALVLIGIYLYTFKNISLSEKIIVSKGDSYAKFYKKLSFIDYFILKIYTKFNDVESQKVQLGTYEFKGTYSKDSFFKFISQGPVQEYVKFTVLEGRSIYDVQNSLKSKGLITGNQYIDLVTNTSKVQEYLSKYGIVGGSEIKTLEGYLYPDTYFLDPTRPYSPQLIDSQLKNFQQKIIAGNDKKILNLVQKLNSDYKIQKFSLYDILKLASVIQKEERNTLEMPTIAGIFFNRLSVGMRLDADITLCYGLKQGYDNCTPILILNNLDDSKNLYNTRQNAGLPPTPIASPTQDAFQAVLNYNKTDNIFYLHDSQGKIWYAKTVQEHNLNKSKYLNGQ